MDSSIKRKILNIWDDFIEELKQEEGCSFKNWVSEIRPIHSNSLEFWKEYTKFKNWEIVFLKPCKHLPGGVFQIKHRHKLEFFGYIYKKKTIFLTSAKSIRLLDYVYGLKESATGEFRVYSNSGARIKNSEVDIIDHIYNLILNKLEIEPPLCDSKNIKYLISPSAKDLEINTGIKINSDTSFYDPISGVIVTNEIGDIHEITHAIINNSLHGFPPFAFREGIAESFKLPLHFKELLSLLENMNYEIIDMNSRPAVFFRYQYPWAQAALFCKRIIYKYGINTLKEVYKKTNYRNFNEYIEQQVGITPIKVIEDSALSLLENRSIYKNLEIL